MKLELKGENLLLRTFEISEVETLYEMVNENREHLEEWFSWVEKTTKIEDMEKFLKEEDDKFLKNKGVYLGIWNDELLSGVISLNHLDLDNKNAEIGYWLNKGSVGNGIMYRACLVLIKHSFETLKLHRLDINHFERNIRSKSLIKKLGFKHEGNRRESGLLHGKYIGHVQYGLLANEWGSSK